MIPAVADPAEACSLKQDAGDEKVSDRLTRLAEMEVKDV